MGVPVVWPHQHASPAPWAGRVESALRVSVANRGGAPSTSPGAGVADLLALVHGGGDSDLDELVEPALRGRVQAVLLRARQAVVSALRLDPIDRPVVRLARVERLERALVAAQHELLDLAELAFAPSPEDERVPPDAFVRRRLALERLSDDLESELAALGAGLAGRLAPT